MEYKDIEGRLPRAVFEWFKALSDIPRGSGNTKAASDLCADFAKERGLRYIQDAAGNVVIYKDATTGYEKAPGVMLQGHLDMVCAADGTAEHDFKKDPIELVLDGDFIRANGTTLGADDGIAAAFMLAILDSHELAHPRLECVFTVDEETGLLGASSMDLSVLSSKYMLNIDSETEGEVLAGCAGGAFARVKIPTGAKKVNGLPVTIVISGLLGGHSGTDIHMGRANASVLAGRVADRLLGKIPSLFIQEIKGGEHDNAITSEAVIKIVIAPQLLGAVKDVCAGLEAELKAEYRVTDPGLSIGVSASAAKATVQAMKPASAMKVSAYLMGTPNGIIAMSQEDRTLPETSLNLGIFRADPQELSAGYLIRSSVDTVMQYMKRRMGLYAAMFGGSIEFSGEYPAWEFKPASGFRDLVCGVYKEQNGRDAAVKTIHAGVECGIFASSVAGLEAVSIGPDMYDIHTPRERLSISSTARTWGLVTAVLARVR